MFFNISSIIIISSTIGFFLYFKKKKSNIIAKIAYNKMVQTLPIEKNCNDKSIQCDIDLLDMKESGELSIISNQLSNNYRWFFINNK